MKGKPFNLVAVGGTFDRLHKGHKELLRAAFNIGRKVVIGITSDKMVARSKSNAKINSLEKRREVLEKWIKEEGLCDLADYEVVVINDVYGVAIYDEKLEALVVSEETLERALTINRLRRDRNLKPLTIVVVPMVLAYNGKPISSTRIRQGEIDQEGRPLMVR
ncbi:MAG: phosphopantetheine adenylyltransferase [Candidatus Nezhaarchaeales archaeon]|nr:MAG: phosphopantetheine adenylyltransferase [Candidatus Nezhaarchaeota archaeon WYZ-LMO8]TDA36974.1 MAG: phosphopantetheine adenylyltransferase [Candidatus Nezhaarchaeota archaeon WYZ-LMO7]